MSAEQHNILLFQVAEVDPFDFGDVLLTGNR